VKDLATLFKHEKVVLIPSALGSKKNGAKDWLTG
jgi:hypothetical protein